MENDSHKLPNEAKQANITGPVILGFLDKRKKLILLVIALAVATAIVLASLII